MEVVAAQVHQPHANGFCENQAQRTASLLEASSCQVFCFQNIKLHTSTKHVASTQYHKSKVQNTKVQSSSKTRDVTAELLNEAPIQSIDGLPGIIFLGVHVKTHGF